MNFRFALATLAAICLLSAAGIAQRNIAVGSPIVENFDSLGAGTANVTNNTTITGVYTFRTNGNAAPNVLPASAGASGTGSLYSFGSAAASDRALGTLSTGGGGATGTMYLGMRIRNNGVVPITSLQIQYTAEQWRDGNGGAETLAFSYQTGTTVTSLTAGTWTAVPALNFISPNAPGGSNAWDGNLPANRQTLAATLSVNVPVGEEIMLRWDDVVASAQGDGFGVDDLTVAVLGPTAAGATISGRVVDGYGRAISSAAITVQDLTGASKTFYTNSFGYYRSSELEVGQSYVISISARRYTFDNPTQFLNLESNISGLNFIARR